AALDPKVAGERHEEAEAEGVDQRRAVLEGADAGTAEAGRLDLRRHRPQPVRPRLARRHRPGQQRRQRRVAAGDDLDGQGTAFPCSRRRRMVWPMAAAMVSTTITVPTALITGGWPLGLRTIAPISVEKVQEPPRANMVVL